MKGDLSNISPSPTTALANRYRIEREVGQGGMACRSVAKATTRLLSLKRRLTHTTVP